MYNPDKKADAIDAIAKRILERSMVRDKNMAYEIARRWSKQLN